MTDKSAPKIKDFINRRLVPRIEDMKSSHDQRQRLFFVSATVSTVIVIALLGFAGYALEIDDFATLEFVVASSIVVAYGALLHGVFYVVFVRGVRARYVDDIVAPLVDFVRPGIDYSAEDSLTQKDFEDSAIAQLPVDEFDSHDLFTTTVADAKVQFSEIEASCKVRKEEERFAARRTCFHLRGLFFSARFDRHFEGTTIIKPTLRLFKNADDLPRVKAGGDLENPIIRPAEDWPHVDWTPENHADPVGEVTVPDPEFHALFDVYSTHIAQARTLLHPAFVEHLKSAYSVWKSEAHRTRLTQTTGRGYFTVVLRNNHLYLARPLARKLMGIRAFEPAEQTELLVQFAHDIQLSIDLIESFAGRRR